MIDLRNRRGRRRIFAAVLPAAMLSLTTSCAPQAIEVKGGPTDCAWAQPIHLGEDSIDALSDKEQALKNAGRHEQAFRVRLDRKAIGDHNRLYERNCTATPPKAPL
ncbi:MAG: hypothetical protein K0S54_3277 [Alphaproteobacteria bacterium]|nr:hypothetical protein [Alphaproteobacteria bacterium]